EGRTVIEPIAFPSEHGESRFRDRKHAAHLLARELRRYRGRKPLVLGIPRGGVVMAEIIARELEGDLDVALVRKLRAPNHPELAVGSITEAGKVYLNPGMEGFAPEGYIRQEAE